jgi:hypothetical protein
MNKNRYHCHFDRNPALSRTVISSAGFRTFNETVRPALLILYAGLVRDEAKNLTLISVTSLLGDSDISETSLSWRQAGC